MTLDGTLLVGVLVHQAVFVVIDAVAHLFAVWVDRCAVFCGCAIYALEVAWIHTDCCAGEGDKLIGLAIAIVIDSVTLFTGDRTARALGVAPIHAALDALSAIGCTVPVRDHLINASVTIIIESIAHLLTRPIRDVFEGTD